MPRSTSRTRIISSQQFNDLEPGSILFDFRTMLDFIGSDGLVTTGKYHQLPQECLFRLDELMTKPLRPKLQRPQLRSFPGLLGLYVLARAVGLVRGTGGGKKGGRISVDAEVRRRWESLNPTEQYFNLLEAWFRFATFDVVGERSSCGDGAFNIWYLLKRSREKNGMTVLDVYSMHMHCTLAVMELFGLAHVVHSNVKPKNVSSVQARATDFGREFFAILLDADPMAVAEFDDFELDPKLGCWQKLFVDRFPTWQRNLEYPQREFRDGVFEFKVSLGSTWRRIEIPATGVLQDLAECILNAYQFDDDHLHAFDLRDRRGVEKQLLDSRAGKEITTADFAVGFLPLSEGESMPFLFDFGDEWLFDVKLERIGSPNSRLKKARITATKGKAPHQYDYDENDF